MTGSLRPFFLHRVLLRLVMGTLVLTASTLHMTGTANVARAIPMEKHTEERFARAATDVLVAMAGVERPSGVVDRPYREALGALAEHVAAFVGVDGRVLRGIWSRTSTTRMRVVLTGMAELGVPYRDNASLPGVAFDCSGFVQYAWTVAGVKLPRGSSAQYRSGDRVMRDHALPGDLVWRPGHVSLYLGVPGAILHTPYGGRQVELHMMNARIQSWVRYANVLA